MELEKLNVDKPPHTFSQDKDGNSRLIFDLLLAHKWWREKQRDESKYANVTLGQLEDYALALEHEIEHRDIKLPEFNDDMPTIRKVWTESAREAALEARRAKAKPPELAQEGKVKLRYALIPRETVDKVKANVNALPSEHLEGISDVYIQRNLGDFTWTDANGAKHTSGTCGEYNPETHSIKISESMARLPGGGALTLYHEVGHHVHDTKLTGIQQSEWNRLWLSNRENMPSMYGGRNYQEGFAECYSRYQAKAPIHPEVESWFSKNVKRKGR